MVVRLQSMNDRFVGRVTRICRRQTRGHILSADDTGSSSLWSPREAAHNFPSLAFQPVPPYFFVLSRRCFHAASYDVTLPGEDTEADDGVDRKCQGNSCPPLKSAYRVQLYY